MKLGSSLKTLIVHEDDFNVPDYFNLGKLDPFRPVREQIPANWKDYDLILLSRGPYPKVELSKEAEEEIMKFKNIIPDKYLNTIKELAQSSSIKQVTRSDALDAIRKVKHMLSILELI